MTPIRRLSIATCHGTRRRRMRREPQTLEGRSFDPPRGEHADRVLVQQECRHHPPGIRALATVVLRRKPPFDLSQIQIRHQIEDEVRQVPLRQPRARRRWHQVRLLGCVRPVGLHAAIRSDRISRVDRFLPPRSRHRAGALASGSPVGEGARRAGSPSDVARSAHGAGLTGGDSTALAGPRPGRGLRSREARGSAPMRPGPRGNPEHSARADHALTWAHAVYELHAPSRATRGVCSG
jgi:hypothetical protein